MPAKAELDDGGKTFTLTVGVWFNTYPVEELDDWIAFYHRNRADHPKSLHSYDDTIAALEALKAALKT
ncbi:hypothetical protein [Thioclava sp. GXIMD4216]|uniref:Uncharacterized protein n=1 Tax=Thioclava litoralis TaxID=3076557 RepID=A0ABZ1DXZ1_9RHOB|nr:hypothetical protein RPE78_08425 [Thioclava sp. FTW29]